MVVLRIAFVLAVIGVSNAQVTSTIPLSNLNGFGGYYNGYQQYQPVSHLGYSGDYSNLGYHHGSYLPIASNSNYGRVPISFNGAVPLGIAGHGTTLNGLGYGAGVIDYNSYNGYSTGYPFQHEAGYYPYSNNGAVLGGYGGLLSHHGLANQGIRLARDAPKVVQTSNEILIAHGNAGTSRQWFNRVDKN